MLDYQYKFIKLNKSYGIRLMNNADDKDIDLFFELFYDCFGFRQHLDKIWFNWYYNQNPNGICNNYLLFDIEHNKLIGAYGFAKIPYYLENKEKIGVLGVNGFIHKDYTKRGLYAELMNYGLKIETKNNLAFSFPHGNNKGSVKGHFNSNWKLFEDLHFFEKEINKRIINKPENIEILEDDFKAIDFEQFNKKNFAFIKDTGFLNWRYTQRPYRKYISIGFKDQENVIAYMILGKYINQDKLIRTQIVDFNAIDINTFEQLLKGAEYFAQIEQSYKIDLILGMGSKYIESLKKQNFHKSGEVYKLMIYPDINESNSNALLGDFDAV
ncbi:MAG: GNAT family N-acetyltransferase [Bacteroidales bacterium]|nr:GNAT family N-acetyltransferase [Bacteroidales bacterium]